MTDLNRTTTQQVLTAMILGYLLGLFLPGAVGAQTVVPVTIPGVPVGVTGAINHATGLDLNTLATLIGSLSGFMVMACTAIAKHFGRTNGITTVTVSAFISAVLTGVGGYYSHVYGTGSSAVMQAIFGAVGAFVAANGIYMAANRKKGSVPADSAPTLPPVSGPDTRTPGTPDAPTIPFTKTGV